jgi:hypothetical protein
MAGESPRPVALYILDRDAHRRTGIIEEFAATSWSGESRMPLSRCVVDLDRRLDGGGGVAALPSLPSFQETSFLRVGARGNTTLLNSQVLTPSAFPPPADKCPVFANK